MLFHSFIPSLGGSGLDKRRECSSLESRGEEVRVGRRGCRMRMGNLGSFYFPRELVDKVVWGRLEDKRQNVKECRGCAEGQPAGYLHEGD